jgi:hypothetical protein
MRKPSAGVAGQLNRTMAQTHVARDREARARFAEAGGVQAVLFEQWLRVCTETAHGVGQAMNEAYRQITQTHRQRFHGLQPQVQQARTTGVAVGEMLTITAEKLWPALA